jgi:hypothetical protein
MPYSIENGIKTDNTKEIANKVVSLLAAEKCTVRESHEILRWAELFVNDSDVTVRNKVP